MPTHSEELSDLNDWSVVVADVIGPHGVRGELRVRPWTEFPERLSAGSMLCLVQPSGARSLIEIVHARPHTRGLLIEISGCDTREDALRLRDSTLTIHPGMRQPLPEGQYYHDQLLGLRVLTVDGRYVGTISDVLEGPGNDVFVTEGGLIPATKTIIQSVDIERKEMIVQPVSGLLDDDED